MTGNGGGADNFPFLIARPELRSRSLDSPQNTAHVDPKSAIDFLRCRIDNRLDRGDSRIVNHDIEAAELLLSMITSRENLVAMRHIYLENCRFPSRCPNFGGRDLHFLFVDIDDRNIGTFLREAQSDRQSDSLSRARDEGNFFINAHSDLLFLLFLG